MGITDIVVLERERAIQMRLIDADELLRVAEDVEKNAETIPNNEAQISGMAHITQLIYEAPTIDAVPKDFHDKCMQIEIDKRMNMVEVVRCKDCDNRFYDKDRNLYYCTMYYGMGDVHDENYCSFGERREDDQE